MSEEIQLQLFLKWLDRNNIEWKIEETQFKLSNNET